MRKAVSHIEKFCRDAASRRFAMQNGAMRRENAGLDLGHDASS
jgi:hypothetical protein